MGVNYHAAGRAAGIIEGEGEYRFGETTHKMGKGDVLGAPCGGPEYAHKLTNTGDATLKYLSISSRSDTDVCEYPDSGKFLGSSRRGAKREDRLTYIGRRGNEPDYWDGEEGAD